MSDVCEHGSLRRQCETCDLHTHIAELCRDLDTANNEIDRLTRERDAAVSELEAAISHYRVELQAERRRARLPAELFERLQEEVEFFARFPSHHKTLHEALLFDIFDAIGKDQQP